MGENVVVDFQRAPPNVAVTGIMDHRGLVYWMTKPKSIKKLDHLELLEDFRNLLGHRNEVAIFMDGLSLHWSKESIAAYARLNFRAIKNIAYNSPENPIEQVWRVIKWDYRRELLRFLSTNKAVELDLFQLVHKLLRNPLKLNCAATISQKHKKLAKRCGAKIRAPL